MSDGALPQDEIDALLAGVDVALSGGKKETKGSGMNVLSQDEIGLLLNAINTAGKEESADGNTDERPNKFSREHLREISLIHEKFASLAAKSLSIKLQRTVKMTVASVDQLYMGEFIRSIPAPTTLGVISMKPLIGGAVLEMDPPITFAIIDKICCSDVVSSKSWRELTDNDKFIMTKFYAGLLDDLRDAWYRIIDLKPRLEDKIETDPRFIRIAPPSEWVALVTLEANINDAEGMLNLCIPHPVIEPVLEKL
ncbi:MAG: hypothetical protein LBH44_00235 [Treponema sp.]|jgi:flagellar motor switch protein FliM|nr:hypothetical protein [Treponema sp.]